MANPAMSLRFKFKSSSLIKDSNLLYDNRTFLKQKKALLALHFLENQSAHFQ